MGRGTGKRGCHEAISHQGGRDRGPDGTALVHGRSPTPTWPRWSIDDINAKGGLLGRQIDLYLEDSATTDSVAEAKATKLVQQDQVDVIFGGIYSSTRQAIKGPAVVEGKKLYIYPEQYEGQECDPLIFCTGPVPAQQVDPLIPWLMQKTGARRNSTCRRPTTSGRT